MWLFVWEVFIIQVLILTVACCLRLHFETLWNGIQRRREKTSIFRWSSSASLTLTSLFILTVFHSLQTKWQTQPKRCLSHVVDCEYSFWLIYISDCLLIGSEKEGESVKFEQRLWNRFSMFKQLFHWGSFHLEELSSKMYSSSNYMDTFQLIGDASRSWSNQKTLLSRYTQ